jgi:hypothetical protein
MTTVDVDKTINSILWGKSIVDVADGQGQENTFVLRSLTAKENNLLDYIYKREYKNAINNGLMPESDLKDIYEVDKIWTNEDDIRILSLRSTLQKEQKTLTRLRFFNSRKKMVKRKISKIKKDIEQLEQRRQQLFNMSAETRAEEIKRRYLIMHVTTNISDERIWPNEKSFLQERDHVLIYNLSVAYFKYNCMPTTVVREIARNPVWRSKWQIGKKGGNLFGKPISEWSDVQSHLVYWSQYYDSIYESLERPDDSVIEDDDACDAWVANQNKQRSAEAVNSKSNKKNKPNQYNFI